MFRNYFKTAFRNVSRNKFYTVLNIVGLAIGLTTTIFILLYIQDELAYDRYNLKYKRIYRIESDFTIGDKHDLFAVTSAPLAPAMKIEFPEIEDYVCFRINDHAPVRFQEKEFYEDNLCFVNPAIFKVFTLKIKQGDTTAALTEPFSIVLTEKLARKYFGKSDPLGKLLTIDGDRKYKVTAVIENLPANSHLKIDGLLSFRSLEVLVGKERLDVSRPENFWNVNFYSYILLKENTGVESIHRKFTAFYEKYMGALGHKINASFRLRTTNLAGIHFNTGLQGDVPLGNIQYIYIFSLVALFILLIASINYMNMATARSTRRAREVGMRKVLGADRGKLQRQFLGESVLLAFLSLIIALGLIEILLPTFNQLSDKQLTFGVFSNPLIFLGIILITFLVGLVSGSYPAFYLASYEPALVLKGRIKTGKEGPRMRKILVVFQFTVSIFMIIATLVVTRQLNFLKDKDLGYDKENVLVTQVQDTTLRKSLPAFRQTLLESTDILNVATSNGMLDQNFSKNVVLVEMKDRFEQVAVNNFAVDYDFIDLMKIRIIKGRNFDRNMGSDANEAVLINETAARKFGWGDNAIGKRVRFDFNQNMVAQRTAKVIGVMKDFNYEPLQNPMAPMVFFLREKPGYFLSVRYKEGAEKEVIRYVKSKWSSWECRRPFDYVILSEGLKRFYTSETKTGEIFTWFSVLSIFIALLGLLGLSSFVASQRQREIGVRKILGASVMNIAVMLSKEFVWLVLLAFLIAAPLSWYALQHWLAGFAYHVAPGLTVFLLAGFLALLVALLSMSYHIFRAATENPVNSVKYE